MRCAALSACLTMIAMPLGAQAASAPTDSGTTACLVLNGIRLGADWGDSAAAAGVRRDSTNRAGRFQIGGTTLDTTLTFDVAERSWSRSSLTAYVAGGVSGRARNVANAAGGRAGWHVCAGVTLGMQQPTLVMRGVHGQLHLKVDLTPLTRLPGATLDSLRQNPIRR